MRMAIYWSSLVFPLLCVSKVCASYTLSSEITNFIPSCAQECFKSFLDANIPTSACTTAPSLACLCSHNSTSGYTIGEGAVQCIISEVSIGFCTGDDADESVASSAYNMCNDEPNALPNTHGTITATLIIQSSMPSVVLVAPPVTVTSIAIPATTSSSMQKTTTRSASSSTKSTSSSTRLLTTIITPSQSPTQTSSSSTTSAQAIQQTETPVPVLTKPQLVGISVASVAGGGLLIGAIILFCCLRRRRKQREMRDSDLLPFQLDPPAHLMDIKKYKYSFRGPLERKPGGTANGVAARVRPQIPPRLDTSSPNMFSRRSIKPDTIGLAISPESNVAVDKEQIGRRSSKLLPEKPNLKLRMPPSPRGAGLSFSQPMRQSTATHFEEDEFDSADTAVNGDDSWGRKSTERILEAFTGPTIRVVDPEAGKSDAFVDAGWRPQIPNHARQGQKDILATPDYYIKPLNVSRGNENSAQGRKADLLQPPAKALQLTIPNNTRPLTASSSVYSARGSLPSSNGGRQSAPRVHRSYRQSGPYDVRQSSGSLTSFDSGTSVSPEEVEPRTAGGGLDLSPVVESPVSGGVSPVVYPKIPGRLSGSMMGLAPPPQPVFTRNPSMKAPQISTAVEPRSDISNPGKPQVAFMRNMGAPQTWSASGTIPQVATQGTMPWRQAEIAAQRERERERMNGLQDQARVAARELQIQVGMQSSIPPSLQAGNGQGHRRNRSGAGSGSHPLYVFPPSANIPRSQTAPPPMVDATGGFGHNSRLAVQGETPYTRSSSAQSQHSQASKASNSSSLLAKRVGEQKAKGLVLRNGDEDGRKWRVLGKEEIERAKGQGWRPMLGAGNVAQQRDGRDAERGGEGRRPYEGMETPITPGWMPTLTPTRRGDDLFLSVQ